MVYNRKTRVEKGYEFMKLEYIIEEKDNNMIVKDIVKKRMHISSRLYTKVSKDIYLNDNKCLRCIIHFEKEIKINRKR